MQKRITGFVLALLLCLGMIPAATAAGGTMNFVKVRAYDDTFTDLPEGRWYTQSVKDAYEYGLVAGHGDTGRYDPEGNIQVSQLLTMAARLHSICATGRDDLSPGGRVWYQPYVDYCLEHDIITPWQFTDYETTATRRQFATVMAASFPEEGLAPINTVEDNAVPDVRMTDPDAAAIYKLYRAGILTGSGETKAFLPDTPIARSEVAAILVRMVDPSQRLSVTLTRSKIDMSIPEGTALGSRIADFSFTAYDGTTYSLYETLEEKKMVLINCWATWCGPCRSEFPAMNEVYEEYRDDVEIFALSCERDDTDSVLSQFAASYGLTFPMGRDTSYVYSDFSTGYIPLTIIVDRFGVICMVEVGAQTSADRFRSAFDLFTSDSYTQPILLTGYPY